MHSFVMDTPPSSRVPSPPSSTRRRRDLQLSEVLLALEKSASETSLARDAVLTCLSSVKESIAEVKDVLGDRMNTLEEQMSSIARDTSSPAARSNPMASIELSLNSPTGLTPSHHAFFLSDMDQKIIRLISKRGRCVHPLLQWICTVSVLSFLKDIPQVSSWLENHEKDRFRSLMADLSGVSGLAMIFFSKDPKDSNAHYRSRDGAVWTFMLRWVFSTMIVSGRRHIYGSSPEREPMWLKSFGSATDTVRGIHDRLKDFERVSDLPSSAGMPSTSPASSTKRRRLSADAPPPRGLDISKELLSSIKSSVLAFLTQNRRQVKLYLFEKLLFLVEKIQSFPNPTDARAAGYYITIGSASDPEELTPIDDITQDSIWNIPFSETGPFQSDDLSADKANQEYMSKVQANFPSMALTLHWQKDIRRSSDDFDQQHPDYSNFTLKWPVSDNIHLLETARGMLMEFSRGASAQQILRASKLSIMALHVLAMGLRALVRSAMGASLTAAEQVALGSVRAHYREIGDNIVSVYVAKARYDEEAGDHQLQPRPNADTTPSNVLTQSPGEGSPRPYDARGRTPDSIPPTSGAGPSPRKTNLQRIRCAKLEISWTQYLLQRRLNDTANTLRMQPLSTASATAPSAPSYQAEEDTDVMVAAASDIMNIPSFGLS